MRSCVNKNRRRHNNNFASDHSFSVGAYSTTSFRVMHRAWTYDLRPLWGFRSVTLLLCVLRPLHFAGRHRTPKTKRRAVVDRYGLDISTGGDMVVHDRKQRAQARTKGTSITKIDQWAPKTLKFPAPLLSWSSSTSETRRHHPTSSACSC